MSDKTKSILMWSAVIAGGAGALYTISQPKMTLSDKDKKSSVIGMTSLGLLMLGAGIAIGHLKQQ